MVDILPYVEEILGSTGAQIELAENEVSAKLPLITLMEVSNSSAFISEHTEHIADIMLQLDIYESTPEKVRSLARFVSSIMIEHGFRRKNGQLMKEDNLWRQMQEYTCMINTTSGIIYCGGNEI